MNTQIILNSDNSLILEVNESIVYMPSHIIIDKTTYTTLTTTLDLDKKLIKIYVRK